MKTFSEFILEAEVAWNTGILKGSKKSPSDTAKQKLSQIGRQISSSRTTPQQVTSLAQRGKKIRSAISGSDEIAKVKDPRPETVATQMGREGRVSSKTKVSGYASKPRDVVSRSGTISNVQRTDLPSEPDVVIQHRYASRGTAGGRGTNVSRTGTTYGTKG